MGRPLTLTSGVVFEDEGQGGPRAGQQEGDKEQETVPESKVFRWADQDIRCVAREGAPPFPWDLIPAAGQGLLAPSHEPSFPKGGFYFNCSPTVPWSSAHFEADAFSVSLGISRP